MKNTINWVIQSNLTNEKTLQKLVQILEAQAISYELVKVIPFSTELPNFDTQSKPIFYGSTTLMHNAWQSAEWREGVFYNDATFSMQVYRAEWGEQLLNADAAFIQFKDLVKQKNDSNDLVFVRPDSDWKAFSGRTMQQNTLKAWAEDILQYPNKELNENTLILIAQPKQLEKEWRNFIVDGQIVSSSRYTLNGNYAPSAEDIPKAMLTFTQNCIEQFCPHPVFVLDIAFHQGQYKIVEAGCFNGTGFYEHDLSKIVKAVSDYRLST